MSRCASLGRGCVSLRDKHYYLFSSQCSRRGRGSLRLEFTPLAVSGVYGGRSNIVFILFNASNPTFRVEHFPHLRDISYVRAHTVQGQTPN